MKFSRDDERQADDLGGAAVAKAMETIKRTQGLVVDGDSDGQGQRGDAFGLGAQHQAVQGGLQFLQTQGTEMAAAVAAEAEGLGRQLHKIDIAVLELEIPLLGQVNVVALQHREADAIEGGSQLQKALAGRILKGVGLPVLQALLAAHGGFDAAPQPEGEQINAFQGPTQLLAGPDQVTLSGWILGGGLGHAGGTDVAGSARCPVGIAPRGCG